MTLNVIVSYSCIIYISHERCSFLLCIKYWNTCRGPFYRSCFGMVSKSFVVFSCGRYLLKWLYAVFPSFKHWSRKVLGSTLSCSFVTMLVIVCQLSAVKGFHCWLMQSKIALTHFSSCFSYFIFDSCDLYWLDVFLL